LFEAALKVRKNLSPNGRLTVYGGFLENFFIVEYFDWPLASRSPRVRLVNGILAKLGYGARLRGAQHTGIMTNCEQRMNMYHLLSQTLAFGVPGEVVELGCHEGQSSVLMRKVLDHYAPERTLHVYDSFQGLPKARQKDGLIPFGAQDLKASKDTLIENFRRYGLRLPAIHEGWFNETLPSGLPDQICFAHLDGDLYESILTSLMYVCPRLSKGAICLIDDYADSAVHIGWNQLPGVKKACDEYFADKPERVSVLYAGDYSHGFFRKA
jgi:O-methyltransferase